MYHLQPDSAGQENTGKLKEEGEEAALVMRRSASHVCWGRGHEKMKKQQLCLMNMQIFLPFVL